MGLPKCPACGSETWSTLARFLQTVPVAPLSQLLHDIDHPNEAPPNQKGDRAVSKQLFIIARNRLKLYQYVKRAFQGNESVEVILDRRVGERRRQTGGRSPERRQADRRGRRDVDNQLRALGWAIVLQDLMKYRRAATK